MMRSSMSRRVASGAGLAMMRRVSLAELMTMEPLVIALWRCVDSAPAASEHGSHGRVNE